MPKIACHTLGCKVNQYDTEAMLEIFEENGYTPVSMDEEADVYLINTCTVTGTGDQKSMKLIRRIRREHPNARIIAAGCLAQRDPQRVMQDGVVLAVGVQRRKDVFTLYSEAVNTETPIDATNALKNAEFENLTVNRHEGKTRATMKIQEGCDRFCAYCIIPYVRGPVRSMKIEDVLMEAERLQKAGYREIVVTGIHLASYGRNESHSLIDAIRGIHSVEGVQRIRLGSLEPVVITEAFASELQALTKVCPQFHLSLQSGSQTVLKRMHRRYTPDEYMKAVDILRKYFPNCAITTDVIAGFPGETEEEFEETLAFIERVNFARLHVFPYSRRSGTVADRMPNQVPEEIKKKRAGKIIEIGNRLEKEYVKSLKGTNEWVLFETCLPDGSAEGYTASYVRVKAKALPGEMKCVHIKEICDTLAIGDTLTGNGGD
ncbi:MAG: tRNA (N(6)-L-threonylcarbamoyladenosine(37)-C(2))-methylthiotransferase MtaB [Clostridia bacterium]|nr:tRNA (N(6)-L-threonylcarbamoyladenosine(37)-C(2))-methylthiotransferase MtaB [Clostridia bacterium]